MSIFKRKTNVVESKRKRIAIQGRSFAAAQTDRLLAGWTFDGGWTSREISSQLFMLRSRSREMSKNSPHFRRWLNLVSINVVGEGFSLKSTPHDVTQAGLRLDTGAAKTIENHFWKWCNHRDENGLTWCDASGRKTMAEINRMQAKTWKRDGEYFAQILKTESNPYGIAIRVLRPDYLDEKYNITLTNGNIIRCGIEMDKITLRPIAYHFTSEQNNGDNIYQTVSGPRVRIPASQIIHGFTQEDEDQPRGIPEAHAILRKLKMIDAFDTAELTAARDEACSVRSYYAPKGDEDAMVDLTDPENSDAAHSLIQEKEPGQSEILPTGYRQEVHTPQHPNSEHGVFKAGMLKDVASGLSVEYANFANDWAGVSFSSVRLGTITERDAWVVNQNDMISQSMTPVYLAWLRSFLEQDISGNLPIEKFDKFSEHEFRGRRWMWVDPMKDVNAAETAVAHGWKTNSQIASDYGGDYDDNVEEIKREDGIVKGTSLEKINEQKTP